MVNEKRPIYDLEERTMKFARAIFQFCKRVPKDLVSREILKQLVRAAGSVGANYIEANEAFSKKDFVYRIKISRKEAKEAGYWLQLLDMESEELTGERDCLLQESLELRKILSAICNKSK